MMTNLPKDAPQETCLELIEETNPVRTDNAKQLTYYLRMVTRNLSIAFIRKWEW